MGDSLYGYLLKVWIQGNRTTAVKPYREMWETSMKGLLSLVRRTTPSSLAYICEKIGSSLIDKMDELACCAPGMLTLGSSGYSRDESQKFLTIAEELAWTCYNFYQSTPTKLAGENYYAGQTYQEWGWNILQAFEKNSRIESGYVGLVGLKDQISKRVPRTKEELLEISGIGKVRLNKFGDRLLETIEATIKEYYSTGINSSSNDSTDLLKRRRDTVGYSNSSSKKCCISFSLLFCLLSESSPTWRILLNPRTRKLQPWLKLYILGKQDFAAFLCSFLERKRPNEFRPSFFCG
ncbi:hypothetical protein F0562_023526 [Nyssa sinensis]|uniref:HRDC domain-containing protein n=1 Tax=Nyssa sinensis TaxID=561372 RepID=A0A5J5BI83_9ASTE|nr:hypothetical protein F0562_023526 [Nyssa sinensis]